MQFSWDPSSSLGPHIREAPLRNQQTTASHAGAPNLHPDNEKEEIHDDKPTPLVARPHDLPSPPRPGPTAGPDGEDRREVTAPQPGQDGDRRPYLRPPGPHHPPMSSLLEIHHKYLPLLDQAHTQKPIYIL